MIFTPLCLIVRILQWLYVISFLTVLRTQILYQVDEELVEFIYHTWQKTYFSQNIGKSNCVWSGKRSKYGLQKELGLTVSYMRASNAGVQLFVDLAYKVSLNRKKEKNNLYINNSDTTYKYDFFLISIWYRHFYQLEATSPIKSLLFKITQ